MQITYSGMTLAVAILGTIIVPIVLFILTNVRAARREADKHKEEIKTSLLTIQKDMQSHNELDRQMFDGLDRRVGNLEGVVFHGKKYHFAREQTEEGEHPR